MGSYDVFLSYAGRDEPQARAIRAGLARYTKPWYRREALRVFLARDVLVPGSGLWPALEGALRRSRWLVLVASPEAAHSTWVQQEVGWWRTQHSDERGHVTRLVIVRTHGTIAWEGEDFDWATTDALPREALTAAFPTNPLRAELPRRPAAATPYPVLVPAALGGVLAHRRSGKSDSEAVGVLRACLVDIAATVHDRDKEALAGEHHRAHRRTMRSVALAAVLVLALSAAVTVVARQWTVEQRMAAAAELVARADVARSADPALALRLGIAADELFPSSRTRAGLTRTLSATRYRGALDGASPTLAPAGPPRAATLGPRSVMIWDVTDPARPGHVADLPVPEGRFARGAAFSPRGTLLAVGDDTGAVWLWDLTGDPVPRGLVATHRLQSPGSIVPATVAQAFTPDGSHLVVSTGDPVPSLWDVTRPDDPRQVATLESLADVAAVAISPDGRTLALGDTSGRTGLWDLSVPSAPTPLPWAATGTGAVTGLAFSAGGLLGVSGPDHAAQVWALPLQSSPRLLATLTNPGGMTSIAFSPTRPLLVTASRDSGLDVWDVSDPTRPRRSGLTIPVGASTVAVGGDGLLFATDGSRGSTTLWTAEDTREPHVWGPPLENGDRALAAVALEPFGRLAAVSTAPRSAGLLDLTDPAHPRPTGTPLAGAGDTVLDLAYATHRPLVAVAASATTLWDTTDPASPRPVATVPPLVDAGFVVGPATVQFSSDDQHLGVVYDNGTAQLWDVRIPDAPAAVGPPLTAPSTGAARSTVSELAFSPDGRTLAIGSHGGTVQLWDATDPAAPAPVGDPMAGGPPEGGVVVSLAFAPDASLLATGFADRTVILWDVTEPAEPVRVGPPLDATAAAESADVAFAPHTDLMVTSDRNGDVVVRDVSDPQEPAALGSPLGDGELLAGSFAVSEDGRRLVVGGWSARIAVVDLGALADLRDDARRQACSRAGRGLDVDEWHRYLPDFSYRATCPR